MTPPRRGTRWICNAPPGQGVHHTVCDVTDGMVTTWSDPDGQHGWSYYGPVEHFLKVFRPVA